MYMNAQLCTQLFCAQLYSVFLSDYLFIYLFFYIPLFTDLSPPLSAWIMH